MKCLLTVALAVALSNVLDAAEVVVDAKKPDWKSADLKLEANTSYVLFPEPGSRWSNGGGVQKDFRGGGGTFAPKDVPYWESPETLNHGQLIALAQHHTSDPNKNEHQYISFAKNGSAFVRTGARGAHLYFMMADVRNGFADNNGTCKVHVLKDGANRCRVELPVKATREYASWTINKDGVVTCDINYTVGAGTGSKHYHSGLVAEYFDGSTATRLVATVTKGRPAVGTVKGTKHLANFEMLPVAKLDQIRRVYVKVATGESGPNTIREWKDLVLDILDDAEQDYQRLQENELVRDVVVLVLAAG